ncbi:MAG: RNA polymerase sigma factor [Crocinitomicaceae bacterium]|nr:RNA polymerase sigma factor [Crocinitomicaceae bacterium]
MKRSEYNQLVTQCSDGLYRYALKLTGSEQHAQDLVQDAYEKIWLKKSEINFEKGKSYLFRTVHNLYIDFYRRTKIIRFEGEDKAKNEVTSNTLTIDLNEILENALNQLNEIQKSAVLLRDFEGYNYTEIGELLNLSESQVKVNIFRARKKLQEIIGKIETVL